MFRLIFLFFGILILINSCGEDCEFQSIETSELPTAKIGEEYSFILDLEASCSIVNKKFILIEGKLPKGILMDELGLFSGKPEESGTFSIKVQVRVCFAPGPQDYTDCHEKTKNYSLVVNE